MSTIADFNRIEDCNKIDPLCIDAYADFGISEDSPTNICLYTSWGGGCVDMTEVVKAAETCTTLYLSPEDDPKCLVYEPECGDNICINGDDLSRIISMQLLKDVDTTTPMADGYIYMYNNTTKKLEPFDLKTALSNLGVSIQNINAAITNIQNKLTPPSDAPNNVSVVFGNTNIYADTNAVIDSSGVATTLDKTHGLYTHTLATDIYGDQIFG